MARPTLFAHRKLLRLSRAIGSYALAVGHLELLWAAANESGEPLIGDADDVEAVARWEGEPGELAAALQGAGGSGRAGFLDVDASGLYIIHDYWDHAPNYVKRRSALEDSRRAEGKSISDKRREAARVRWDRERAAMQTGCILHPVAFQPDALGVQSDAPPAPAPAPAPAPNQEEGERAPASGASPRRPRTPRFDPHSVPIPEELDTPEFREAWELRLVERGEPGDITRPSETQIRAQLRKLVKLAKARGLPQAIFCVERAVEGRHEGIVFSNDFAAHGRNGARTPPPDQRALPTGGTQALAQRMRDLDEAMRNQPPLVRQKEGVS